MPDTFAASPTHPRYIEVRQDNEVRGLVCVDDLFDLTIERKRISFRPYRADAELITLTLPSNVTATEIEAAWASGPHPFRDLRQITISEAIPELVGLLDTAWDEERRRMEAELVEYRERSEATRVKRDAFRALARQLYSEEQAWNAREPAENQSAGSKPIRTIQLGRIDD